MAASFFKDTKFEDGKLNSYDIEIEKTGIPVFKNINAYFECKVLKIIEGGDHDIIVAEIKNAENLSDQGVLNLEDTGWKYAG